MKKLDLTFGVLAVCSLTWLVGCGGGNGKPAGTAADAPSAAAAKYLLSAEPSGAKNVVEVREQAKHNDEVVVVGRIGGEANPWVEGMAAFKIADLKCVPCNEHPGDKCENPWDYCCEDPKELATSVALVQIVDDQGKVVAEDAKKTLGFKELQTVVVQGTAERDDKQNLIVHAKKVFIRK